jgi:hypothetical protein
MKDAPLWKKNLFAVALFGLFLVMGERTGILQWLMGS